MLRRPLAALFIALLVAGALPTPALAAIPIASAVNTATAEEVPVTITLTGGDLDLHDITAFDVTSGPAHGSLGSIGPISCPVETPGICLADVTYTSEAGWWGTDEFLYTATGQDGTSVPGLASILVAQLNDAPSFTVGTDVTVDEDSGAYSQPWATSISPGDPYEVAQHLTWDLQATNLDLFVTAPQLAPDGTLEFEARPDWSGSSTVTVRLKDDGGTDTWSVPGAVASDTSAQETFVITVVPVNDAPTPSGFSTSLPWGIRWLLGSLSATDIDGDDTTTFTVVTPPAHGDLELLGPIVCSGSVARDCSASAIFTADPGYVGPDSFTYTATDGVTVSTPATVLITVTDNTAPVCDDQSAEAD